MTDHCPPPNRPHIHVLAGYTLKRSDERCRFKCGQDFCDDPEPTCMRGRHDEATDHRSDPSIQSVGRAGISVLVQPTTAGELSASVIARERMPGTREYMGPGSRHASGRVVGWLIGCAPVLIGTDDRLKLSVGYRLSRHPNPRRAGIYNDYRSRCD